MKAHRGGTLADQVFCAFLGPTPREDFIPYVADFFLQLEDVEVDGHRRHRQRLAGDLGAQPRLHEERGRVRAPLLRRHRQRRRPPRDGEGRRPDARVPREVRRDGRRRHRRCACRPSSTSSCSTSRRPTKARNTRVETVGGCRCRAVTLSAQRLIQIGNQIRDVFEADREPQHPLRHARRRAAGRRCVPTAT